MIGFGTTQLVEHAAADAPRREDMIALLRTAAAEGAAIIDTAEVIGPYTVEKLIGDALGDCEVPVATKFGWNIVPEGGSDGLNSRPEHIREVAHASLRRLQRERIDVFYQHRVDPEVPIEDVAGTAKELIDEGLIASFGLSEAAPETIRRAHAECPVGYVESEYSLWERGVEDEILPLCRELGIRFVAFSPLGKGFFAGGKANAESSSPRLHPQNWEANQRLLEPVREIAQAHDASSAQIALAWLVAKDVVPIPGTTNVERLRANLAAAQLNLSAEEIARLDGLVDDGVAGARYTDKHLGFIDG